MCCTSYKSESDVQGQKDDAWGSSQRVWEKPTPLFWGATWWGSCVRVPGQPGQRGTSASTLVIAKCQAVLAVGQVKMFYLLIFVSWREPWDWVTWKENVSRGCLCICHIKDERFISIHYSKIVSCLFCSLVHLLGPHQQSLAVWKALNEGLSGHL